MYREWFTVAFTLRIRKHILQILNDFYKDLDLINDTVEPHNPRLFDSIVQGVHVPVSVCVCVCLNMSKQQGNTRRGILISNQN